MKTELILLLYDELIGGKIISRAEFCLRYSVSERTFYRYMHEISVFLRTNRSSCVLDVVEPQGRYFIKCDDPCRLTEPVSKLFD